MDNVSELKPHASIARLQLAEHARRVHLYTAISGLTLEDLKEPGYFDKLGRELRRYDEIIVVCDDDSFYGEFLVLEANNLHVRTVFKRGAQLEGVSRTGAPGASHRPAAELGAFTVAYKGAHRKWCALQADKILRDEFETEDAAQRWIADHAATIARGAA